MERINDYEEYKSRVSKWIDKIVAVCSPDDVSTIKAILTLAKKNDFTARFVFQDETEAHFNHDVAKECQKRLTH